MEQRTCNIIMCCKGHCELDNAGNTSMDAIAAYMSKECACPKEDYKGQLMESILRTAMFDFFSCADKPDVELRHRFSDKLLAQSEKDIGGGNESENHCS